MMDEHESKNLLVKGSAKPYLGAGLVGGLLALPSWWLEMEWTGILGLGLLGIGSGHYLFFKTRQIEVSGEGVRIRKGLLSSKTIDFSQIQSIRLQEGVRELRTSLPLMDTDLSQVKDWGRYPFICIKQAGKRRYLLAKDFSKDEYQRLAHGLQHFLIQQNGSSLQKLGKLQAQTKNYLAQDRKIWSELNRSLYDTCKSLYTPFETLSKKEVVEELEADASVVHYTVKQGNVLVYFRKGEELEEVSPANREILANLIGSVKDNLQVVEARLQSHEELLGKMEQLVLAIKNQKRLESKVVELNKLQEKNLLASSRPIDVGHEAEIIQQYELLNENIHQATTYEQSILLQENMKLVEEKEEALLKEINEKISR